MAQHQKDPLRPLAADKVTYLESVSHSYSDRASRVTRSKILLAVARSYTYTEVAHSVGRRSGDAVGALVSRFNQEGIVG